MVAFLPAIIGGGYIWDDDTLLTANPLVHSPSGLVQIWEGKNSRDYTPLTISAFWLEWRIWGARPPGYHIVNLLLHAISAVLLWRILVALRVRGAWLGALLFAIHPINAASAAWVAELKNTLSSVFFLGSILAFITAYIRRDSRWIAASVALFALAGLSKGAVVTLPIVLAGCLLWMFGKITRRDLLRLSPFFLIAAVVAWLTIHYQARAENYHLLDDSFPFRIARAGIAVWWYLRGIFFPIGSSPIAPQWHIDTHSPVAYIPAIAAAVLFALFFWNRKGAARPLFFAYGYFLWMLLPVLGFVWMTLQQETPATDWWQYMAAPGIFACIAAGFDVSIRNAVRGVKLFLQVSLGVIITLLFFLSWRRAMTYESMETYCRAVLAEDPHAWTLQNNLGVVLKQQGDFAQAIACYRQSLSDNPRFVEARNNLANALTATGNFAAAQEEFQKALQLSPNNPVLLSGLALALFNDGKIDDAYLAQRHAITVDPANPRLFSQFGRMLVANKQYPEAVSCFHESLRRDPGNIPVQIDLIRALLAAGRNEEAATTTAQSLDFARKTGDTKLIQASSSLSNRNPRSPAGIPHDRQPPASASSFVICWEKFFENFIGAPFAFKKSDYNQQPMPADFVHLHLHSEYSTLDGAVRIPELMKKAKEFGMPAVAITDHGNMFGAIEFYQEAVKQGIKPIIGCEIYMAPGKLTDRQATSGRDAAFHFTLLAKDNTGYHNLIKLVSLAHLDGMYYKPRIDKEALAKYSRGLIGLSGCLKGEINMHIQADQLDKARKAVGEYKEILGAENFFLELHSHGIEAQRKCNNILPTLAHEFGLGLVAANDVHFLEKSQHEAHDVMICIGTGSNMTDEKRMHYVPELYFKSTEQMQELFADHPGAVANTVKIADKCNLKLEFGRAKYPAFTNPPGMTSEQHMRKICQEGLLKRYGARVAAEPALQQRLDYELDVLIKTGFIDYFLIVWDFIKWAKDRGIPVGPGRGSAAGAMVAYVMEITDIDPLQFGLLFERFMNPERVSPPDIDVDFCQNRRGEVIEYVRQKYGERAVAQIATFGTMGAKSVVRDVGRVMGLSYGDADRIAKMIPNELNINLKSAADKNPDLKKAIETENSTRQLWEYATTLEGLTRNVGVHAAGVVISDRDLSEYIPLTRGNANEVVSQYAMGPLTDLGLLKMDFLGLKTLTVIRDAEVLLRRSEPGFDINKIPLDDAPTFALLNRGEVIGLFQLDGGMASWCKTFDFKSIDDIIALNALYRPGPMDLIPDYVKRKNGHTKIKYAHPLLEQVCSDTFGLMIYQEQVMAAARVLGGYTLGQADLLRRAMGKKDVEKMAKERKNFVEGCKKTNGIDDKKANEIFDLLEKFAGYGFNKSHSAAYGWITYQTAYLKANYTVEFMAALLSNEVNNTDKISIFVGECKRLGIEILPPDVNRSSLKFSPEISQEKRGIRFGLAAIKNVGEAAMEAAIAERASKGPFTSLEDFCRRLDSRKINKKVIESLVKCGAFDFTGEDRATIFAAIDETIARSASDRRDKDLGQHSLFGSLTVEESAPQKRITVQVPAWPTAEKLGYEKELLGFYVTGHPLDEYRSVLEGGKYSAIIALAEQEDKSTVQVAGALENVEKKFTKKDGKPFAIVVLEDLTGTIEVRIWSEAFAKCSQHLEKGEVVSMTARLDRRDEALALVASEVKPLKAPPAGLASPVSSSTPAK